MVYLCLDDPGLAQGPDLVRLFLCEKSCEPTEISPQGATTVRLTHLTNYATLGELIEEFNAQLDPMKRNTIDPAMVRLRNAMADARVLSEPSAGDQQRLFKFARPVKGSVVLEFDELQNAAWFAASPGANQGTTLSRHQLRFRTRIRVCLQTLVLF